MSRGVSLGRQRLADCRIEWDIRMTRPELLPAIQSEAQANIEREVCSPCGRTLPSPTSAAEAILRRKLVAFDTVSVADGFQSGADRMGASPVISGPYGV